VKTKKKKIKEKCKRKYKYKYIGKLTSQQHFNRDSSTSNAYEKCVITFSICLICILQLIFHSEFSALNFLFIARGVKSNFRLLAID